MRRITTLLLLMLSLNMAAQTTYTRRTNLPHVYINTFNRQAINSKTTYIWCTLIYVNEKDQVTTYDSVQIRGRGNSTWGLSKKPYRIRFQEKKRFLGANYANARSWTFLANAGDKSLIRNAITSEMTKFMGMDFNPAAKFVDLTLNNVFMGNYQISDQVDVKSKRVDIAEQDYPLTPTSDISGGYLLEVDGFNDGNWFRSSRSLPIRIHEPDEDVCSSEQKSYINNYVNSFENALFSANFTDPVEGYRPYVDSLSMANLYLANEISANIDGFWSLYFYKQAQNPKFYFGPPWDYDIAYDNDYRITGTTYKLMVDDGYGDARTWFKQMWNDPEWFSKLINRRFKEVVNAGLENYLYEKIDSLAELLQESQQLNYNKWGISGRMYHEVYLYGSYDQYIQQLKDFIHEHLIYLETAFASRMPQEPTPPFSPANFYYNILNINTNTAIDIAAADGSEYSEDNLPEPGALICCWQNLPARQSVYWEIVPQGDYFMIINRLGLALNDPTPGTSTATTNTGTQLDVAEPNPEDPRQLWSLTPQGTQGYYNLTNVYTDHTANLSGGSSANGTTVISYTTDARNNSSPNRLWYIVKTDLPLSDEPEPDPSFWLGLSEGWNWASHIMEEPLDVSEFKDKARRIVAQTKETYNDEKYGMTGSLTTLSAGQLFKIYMEKSGTFIFEGNFCSANLPVSLKPGWNWIGYTQIAPNGINEALEGALVEENDIIMGQQGFALYSSGQWVGTLTSLDTGLGYVYFTNSSKAIRFNDPTATTKRRAANTRTAQNDFNVKPTDYPDVMGIVASVRQNGFEVNLDDYTILAFANGECRGVGQTINDLCFITIYGNGGENLEFKALNNFDNTLYDIAESERFSLAVKGRINDPVILNIGESDATGIDDIQMADNTIQAVYSLAGAKVATNTENLQPGTYIVTYTNGSSRKIHLTK